MTPWIVVAAATLVLTVPGTASAQSLAFVTTELNLRAGPDNEFPVVAVIPDGDRVRVFGCVRGYEWCDVAWRGTRGWVFAEHLEAAYQGRRVAIIDYGPQIALPLVTFSIGDYWGTYYRNRPFFDTRQRFVVRFGSEPWFRFRAGDRDFGRGDRDFDRRGRDFRRGDVGPRGEVRRDEFRRGGEERRDEFRRRPAGDDDAQRARGERSAIQNRQQMRERGDRGALRDQMPIRDRGALRDERRGAAQPGQQPGARARAQGDAQVAPRAAAPAPQGPGASGAQGPGPRGPSAAPAARGGPAGPGGPGGPTGRGKGD